MSDVIVLRGLPGSGKSTWARDWVAEDPDNRVRVNRDEIRFASFGKYWGVDEDFVTAVETASVKAAIKAGKDVVIDATHLRASYVKKWARIHPITVKEFPIAVDVAVERDSKRSRTVGEKVIRDMARRFLNKDGSLKPVDLSDVQPDEGFKPAPKYDYSLPDAIIVDTDGTLADLSHRSPFAQDEALYAKDGVYGDVATIVRKLAEDYHIIGVSGREDKFREVTERWWLVKAFLKADEFYMRATGDQRNDALVKSEIFDNHIAGRYNVIGVLDDRLRVARMWHAKGLTVLRVNDPDADF